MTLPNPVAAASTAFLIVLAGLACNLEVKLPEAKPPSEDTRRRGLIQGGAHVHTSLPALSAGEAYEVHSVIDGDTFRIVTMGGTDTVRLIGIDAPETVHPSRPVGCFGPEAAAEATYLLSGQRVVLEADPSQGERDRYGRLLAYAYLEDTEMANELLLRGGYAREYTYHAAAAPYRHRDRFRAAERLARQAGAGMWAAGACDEKPR